MRILYTLAFSFLLLVSCKTVEPVKDISSATSSLSKNGIKKKYKGFFNFWWDKQEGKVWLEIDKLNTEFLYVNSLAAGVGSNDIGLDRGQLGDSRVVKFVRTGPTVLLIEPNYKYRAVSDNEDEKRSVEEAFAQSVLWGFKVVSENGNSITVDATDFLMRDAHGVAETLEQNKQGEYKLETSRSAIYLPQTKNFPKNTEFEATLTFTGKAKGSYIRSVTPSSDAVTVRQHHSFVELPDKDYKPRKLDPRCGYFGISYQDYATPINEPLVKRFILRHRLKKKNPSAAISEAVEPIIYYVDRGAPEPIRSALIEGASWWNQAFEAAGYKNAFQVKVFPEGADPMDVRYNLIQWVHRSTRGWSYGGSVSDPRTGEIIKGHVSLGSLRVRQDFLIAQGLIAPYEKGEPVSDEMEQMALARLRQLSAHEVGHTLGIAHNFAASTNDRASVMDYPHPYISLKTDGSLDFSKAYDDKIGAWDKRTVIYGYQDFPEETDESKVLNDIIDESIKMGLRYISDSDARPQGGSHPYAHLWDNGSDAVEELNRMMEVRKVALANFSEKAIPLNTPMSSLEEVLVPLYLSHRYQVEGVVKLIGGLDYSYAMRGDGQTVTKIISADMQRKALDALLATLEPEVLAITETILQLIPPKTFGYDRGRESFKVRTRGFDPIAAAESSANHSLQLLLNPARVTRLIEHHARDQSMPSLATVIEDLLNTTWKAQHKNSYHTEIGRAINLLVLHHLMHLAVDENASAQANAIAFFKINELEKWLENKKNSADKDQVAHYLLAQFKIKQFKDDPQEMLLSKPLDLPAGSPIGQEWKCGGIH